MIPAVGKPRGQSEVKERRMIARIGLSLLACTLLAAAQPASSKTKPMKEEKGRCQAAVPAEATVILPYMAQGPNKSYSVILDYDSDGYKVLTDADLKEYHYSKAYENSSTRQILEKDAHATTAGYRTIHVYLPLAKGQCHAGITFKTGVSEAPMLGIAKSVALTK
jgi:hypothetical protein